MHKPLSEWVIGFVAIVGLFGGPFVPYVPDLIVVLLGWPFAIGFVVMAWKKYPKASTRVGLIVALIVALSISAQLSKALHGY